ncbi:recombinase family protein [Pseudonocardia sp. WMMC193]|uniref:recombinase family protein n=1 Tax=Pseudonocardia sp. WMMC193 TaxID=2911965 RepID=UPI001F23CF44|nr:recombinase family protein [Pseudonocardia sp. WMMC193]MCF7548886.1 recombinase family protein [Pseudonocardia sp. WMMC193]
MRAAVHLRISQDRTGEELGVTRQRIDAEALLERRGWINAREYMENDTSAAGRKARPVFRELLADITAGKYDVVVAWSLDRLARTARDRLDLIDACRAHDVLIALVRGSDIDLSTPAGRLTAGVLGEVAQHEVDAKSDRQLRAHRQAAAAGRRVGGRKPFGYEADGVTIRDVEADAIRTAFADYLAGTPIKSIARQWNEAGLLSGQTSWKTGEPGVWDHTAVRKLLKNARYAGKRVHKGEITGDAEWPAIVDEVTFRRVGALLDSAASAQKPRAGRRLLTGVALCGVCSEPVHAGGAPKGYGPVYRCPSGRHLYRRGELVDEQVQRAVIAILNNKEWRKRRAEQVGGDDHGDLAEQAEEIRAELAVIAQERAQRKITREQFDVMNTELQAQLVDVESRMTVANSSPVLTKLLASEVTAETWLAVDADQRRSIIAALFDVRVYSGGKGVRTPPPSTVQVTPKG